LNIQTTRFGTIALTEERIIQMPYGLFGFPDQKRFVVLEHRNDSPFFWYQSLDEPNLAFVITSPYLFKPDYTLDVDKAVKEMAWNGVEKPNSLDIYIVVNIPKGAPHKMTANLVGPILVNTKIHEAVQVAVANSSYTHKYPLIQ
jgi:flagellar assembly factor FliW